MDQRVVAPTDVKWMKRRREKREHACEREKIASIGEWFNTFSIWRQIIISYCSVNEWIWTWRSETITFTFQWRLLRHAKTPIRKSSHLLDNVGRSMDNTIVPYDITLQHSSSGECDHIRYNQIELFLCCWTVYLGSCHHHRRTDRWINLRKCKMTNRRLKIHHRPMTYSLIVR